MNRLAKRTTPFDEFVVKMKYRIFQFPLPVEDEIQELNVFLASHRITAIKKTIVCRDTCPAIVFIVEYLDQTNRSESTDPRGSKIDYRKTLTPEQFEIYSRLRDVRKAIADQEGVPVYTILTNAQLADIVTRDVTEIAGLHSVPGIGQARIDKYGSQLVQVMQDAAKGRQTPP